MPATAVSGADSNQTQHPGYGSPAQARPPSHAQTHAATTSLFAWLAVAQPPA